MYIHKLGKSCSGGGGRFSVGLGKKANRLARDHKRLVGEGLVEKIYEDGAVHKPTELLRRLNPTKPRIPKKYISLDI